MWKKIAILWKSVFSTPIWWLCERTRRLLLWMEEVESFPHQSYGMPINCDLQIILGIRLLQTSVTGGATLYSSDKSRLLTGSRWNFQRKTFVSPMMGCWRFSDPRILGAVAASQQTFFIVSGSHSS